MKLKKEIVIILVIVAAGVVIWQASSCKKDMASAPVPAVEEQVTVQEAETLQYAIPENRATMSVEMDVQPEQKTEDEEAYEKMREDLEAKIERDRAKNRAQYREKLQAEMDAIAAAPEQPLKEPIPTRKKAITLTKEEEDRIRAAGDLTY